MIWAEKGSGRHGTGVGGKRPRQNKRARTPSRRSLDARLQAEPGRAARAVPRRDAPRASSSRGGKVRPGRAAATAGRAGPGRARTSATTTPTTPRAGGGEGDGRAAGGRGNAVRCCQDEEPETNLRNSRLPPPPLSDVVATIGWARSGATPRGGVATFRRLSVSSWLGGPSRHDPALLLTGLG